MQSEHSEEELPRQHIKHKLERYRKIREKVGKSRVSDLFDSVISDDDSMNDAINLSSSEEVSEHLGELSSLSAEKHVQKVIDLTVDLSNAVKKLDGHIDEDVISGIEESADSLAEYAQKEQKEILLSRYVSPASFGGYGAVSTFITNVLGFTVSGAQWLQARNRLDFHYWLEDELINRTMYINELSNLGNIPINEDLNEKSQEIIAMEREMHKIKPFGDLIRNDIDKLTPQKYREMLLAIFERFSFKEGELTANENEFIEKHKYINDKTIHSYLALLEKRHIVKKLDECEKSICTRLLARFEEEKNYLTRDDTTKKILEQYTDDNRREESEKFNKIVDAFINPDQSDIKSKEISTAKTEEKKIKEQLDKEHYDASLELTAKAFLLLAAALTLALVTVTLVSLAFSIPGVGPTLVGLAVAVIACSVIAYLIKPDIFSGIKNDVTSHWDSIMRHYEQWKIGNEIKSKKQKTGRANAETYLMFKGKSHKEKPSKEELHVKALDTKKEV